MYLVYYVIQRVNSETRVRLRRNHLQINANCVTNCEPILGMAKIVQEIISLKKFIILHHSQIIAKNTIFFLLLYNEIN